MKKNIFFGKLLLAFCISIFIFSNCSSTKDSSANKRNLSASDIQSMVDSHRFTFVAQTANSARGHFRNLTSRYDVRVSSDSLVSYLPYYGRAYTAPIDPSQGGLDFTSTNFSYDATHEKSNKWNVVLKPGNGQDVQQLDFVIFDNGTSSLNVSSNSRDPISFNGYIVQK